MGGEIWITKLNPGAGSTHRINLILYRDNLGVGFATDENIIVDPLSPSIPNFYVKIFTDSLNYKGINAMGYARIETRFYSAGINLISNESYTFYFAGCCQNACISNIPIEDTTAFALKTTYENATAATNFQSNSSPRFLNSPIGIGNVLTPIIYNPLAYDSDGDSLAYSLEVPISFDKNHNHLFDIPWTTPLSDSSAPFTLDTLTGIICWTPSTIGCWQFTVGVKEYRNGVLIGSILRDFQMMIDAPQPNQITPTPNYSGCTPINFSQPIAAKSNGSLELDFSDVSPTTTFEGFGEPFLYGARLKTMSLSATEKRCTVKWRPFEVNAREAPYTAVIRVGDSQTKTIYGDYTISFRVVAAVPEQVTIIGQAYPNPASQSLTIPVEMREPAELTVSLLDLSGKIVYQRDYAVNTGSSQVEMPVTVSDGIYMLRVQSPTGLQTQKISIQR